MMGYDYVTQYSKRDFIDVIRLLESWLRVNQEENYEWTWCNHVIPLNLGLDVGDRSHIGSVRRPCEGATEQGTQTVSTSWQMPSDSASKRAGSSVFQSQGIEFCHQLKWPWKKILSLKWDGSSYWHLDFSHMRP